jgi:hypothetical protein
MEIIKSKADSSNSRERSEDIRVDPVASSKEVIFASIIIHKSHTFLLPLHIVMLQLEVIVLVNDLHVQVSLILLVEFFLDQHQEGDQSVAQVDIEGEIDSFLPVDNIALDMAVDIIIMVFAGIDPEKTRKLKSKNKRGNTQCHPKSIFCGSRCARVCCLVQNSCAVIT